MAYLHATVYSHVRSTQFEKNDILHINNFAFDKFGRILAR
jgi:hypothetical protein